MIPQRISVKLFVDNPETVHLPAVIPVFHRWIQQGAVEGLLIDVADYRHVPDGPGVLLIGHEGDYAIDTRDGRPGVQYTRKRGWPDDRAEEPGHRLRQRLRVTLRLARQAGDALQAERLAAGRLAVRRDAVELRLLDQLRTPNSAGIFAAVCPDVEAVLAEFYAGMAFTLQQASTDPRLPLTITAVAS